MGEPSLQQQFFRAVRAKLPSNLSLADSIADCLNISVDSAYRRIRGEKPISLEETQKLCKYFKVSVDSLIQAESNNILFTGDASGFGESFHFHGYLEGVHNLLMMIRRAKTKKLYYEAKDMPLFHYFQFPELAAFKFFFWMKTIYSYPVYARTQYEDNDLMPAIKKIGPQILQEYSNIPSAEIWSEESVNATIRQIEYYRYSGVFRNPESADLLYEQLELLLEHIKEQAEAGEKFMIGSRPGLKEKNYELYFNEVYLGHNFILVETDDVQTAFINSGILNYISTQDAKFCSFSMRLLNNTMKKSTFISSVGEKERNFFFNLLKSKISHARVPANH